MTNIEALLALIFEDKILEFLEFRTNKTRSQLTSGKDIDDITYEIIDDTLFFLGDLYELEPNFFSTFPRYFEFDEWYDKLFDTKNAMDGLIVELFDRYHKSESKSDVNLRTKLFGKIINTAIRTVVLTEPQLMKNPEYSQLICDLAVSIIKSPIDTDQ